MDLGILQETFGVLWDAFFMRTGAWRASREDALLKYIVTVQPAPFAKAPAALSRC